MNSVYVYTTIYYCLLFNILRIILYYFYVILCQCNRFMIKCLIIFSFAAIAHIDNKPLMLYHKYEYKWEQMRNYKSITWL